MIYSATRRAFLAASTATFTLPALPVFAHRHAHAVKMLNKQPNDSKMRHVFLRGVLAVQRGKSILSKQRTEFVTPLLLAACHPVASKTGMTA